ncbi:helix-turn-helix transcriptional regulator [Microlunatus elymi]|uniref:Helix-turn-helix transcriptional regulator n=1 Tax=Microlunatus elymi TaxID=2596828 RepID=A0A516PVR5_9ACTN|nr:helix-turn-helix transcriptional regulator [Microlunatus elymi]QDP95263.1 helix-turn-helix transcriptional regulator [Microlunatus elymi]
MTNRRLRGAMLNAELTPARLAELAEVDVKTVQRWLNEDRIPYPATRRHVAQAVGQEETYLWPSVLLDGRAAATAGDISGIWPTCSSISAETWHVLFERATKRLDILAYAGTFLLEVVDLGSVLRSIAGKGASVRILVGDPSSPAVRARSDELGTEVLPEHCREMLHYLQHSLGRGVPVRQQSATIYAGHFRFDDILLINPHAYGIPAAESPVLQFQDRNSPAFTFYTNAFERAWVTGAPTGSERAGAPDLGGYR